MKNKYLSLLFASFLIVSGCETIGGSSSSSDSPSYEYGDSKQANLQGYYKMKLVTEFTLKQINIIFHLLLHLL